MITGNFTDELRQRVDTVASPADLVEELGIAKFLERLQSMYKDEVILEYVYQYCIREFCEKRIIINFNQFTESFYGKKSEYVKYGNGSNKELGMKIRNVVVEVNNLEKERFINDNRKEMNLKSDFWRMCFLKGPALNKRDFDFEQIESSTLRLEAKMFFRHKLWNENNFRNDRGFALLYAGLNIITRQFPYIAHFADITELHISYLISILQTDRVNTQFGEKYSVESLRKMVQIIGSVTEYLMDVEGYGDTPKFNYAKGFSFHNVQAMSQNTDIIPDDVANELDKYYHELDPNYQLIYEILRETGLRLKEVTFLKKDCLSESKVDKSYFVLEYTPYKILNKLKRSSQAEKKIVLINDVTASKLFEKISETETLRDLSDSDYIFLRQVAKEEDSSYIAIAQESNYVLAVNKLIERHNILGAEGELWYYTSRQARKTLAVTMAENGATSQEIASQFGHMNNRTTDIYYAEVRRKRLAQLNSEFFKKRFALFVGEDNLKQYSEEERRQLYVDFAMNMREVEFGQCSKHISEGPCGKRTGRSNCATCPKLCTGKPYLDKWIALRDSQENIVKVLVDSYRRNNIEDYEAFVEYRKEMKLLKEYQSVIDNIYGKEAEEDA